MLLADFRTILNEIVLTVQKRTKNILIIIRFRRDQSCMQCMRLPCASDCLCGLSGAWHSNSTVMHYWYGPNLRLGSLLCVPLFLLSYYTTIFEFFHCAGALRLDNHKDFPCPGCKVSLHSWFILFSLRASPCLVDLAAEIKKYSALYLPFEKSLDVFFYSIISFTIHAFVHRDFVNYVRDAHGQVRLRQQEENLIYICWAAAVRIQLKFNAVTLREKGEHFRWWKLWAWIRGAAALPSSNPTRRETSPHSASSECMGRKGVREGALAPLWILKLLAKKGCFFNFEG